MKQALDTALFCVAYGIVRVLQTLPLGLLAWLGRRSGELIFWLDRRHRQIAQDNLTKCFGSEKSPAEIHALARQNFRRIGETCWCVIKTAAMNPQQLRARITINGMQHLAPKITGGPPVNRVFAIGHFGNFELFAHAAAFDACSRSATTYRALNQPAFDRLLLVLRQKSGCLFFERRRDNAALQAAMKEKNLFVGLVSDQHAGKAGVWMPFLGHMCSTTTAPAVLEARYKMPLHTAICYRTMPGRWHIEVSPEISVYENGRRRTTEEIMRDVNRNFELAIRRDPANWFWLHRRWKQPVTAR